jgi:hypothetical protein
MAALFVLAGVGLASLLSPLVSTALANVGQVVNISDHSGSAFFAKVGSDGRLAVGDGAGPLSVDGTVSARPAAPLSLWRARTHIEIGAYVAGPSVTPINVTSLSISTDAPSGSNVHVFLAGYHVPISATNCNGATLDGAIWEIRDLGDGITPLAFSFPTPLQYKPPPQTKACLWATLLYTNDATTMNAVGFYGG